MQCALSERPQPIQEFLERHAPERQLQDEDWDALEVIYKILSVRLTRQNRAVRGA